MYKLRNYVLTPHYCPELSLSLARLSGIEIMQQETNY